MRIKALLFLLCVARPVQPQTSAYERAVQIWREEGDLRAAADIATARLVQIHQEDEVGRP